MFLIGARSGPDGARRTPVPLKELPRYPLIVPSRPNANRKRIESQLAYFGLKPAIALEVDGIASILDLVSDGYGYAVLPLVSLRGYRLEDAFTTRPIVKPKLMIQITLVTSSQRPSTPLAQKVLALIPETAAEVIPGVRYQPPDA